jgi:hypothetical protein
MNGPKRQIERIIQDQIAAEYEAIGRPEIKSWDVQYIVEKFNSLVKLALEDEEVRSRTKAHLEAKR